MGHISYLIFLKLLISTSYNSPKPDRNSAVALSKESSLQQPNAEFHIYALIVPFFTFVFFFILFSSLHFYDGLGGGDYILTKPNLIKKNTPKITPIQITIPVTINVTPIKVSILSFVSIFIFFISPQRVRVS